MMSACWVRVGMPVDGPAALHVDEHGRDLGVSSRSPRNSFISEMPGPLVGVNARAPFQLAPSTMPMAASSSSAWMMRR